MEQLNMEGGDMCWLLLIFIAALEVMFMFTYFFIAIIVTIQS